MKAVSSLANLTAAKLLALAITVESGSSMTPGTFASSKAKLQRAAAELGATAVRITTHNVSGKIDRATGVAIKCIKREGQ